MKLSLGRGALEIRRARYPVHPRPCSWMPGACACGLRRAGNHMQTGPGVQERRSPSVRCLRLLNNCVGQLITTRGT